MSTQTRSGRAAAAERLVRVSGPVEGGWGETGRLPPWSGARLLGGRAAAAERLVRVRGPVEGGGGENGRLPPWPGARLLGRRAAAERRVRGSGPAAGGP